MFSLVKYIILLMLLTRSCIGNTRGSWLRSFSSLSSPSPPPTITTINESVVFSGYRNVIRRKVILPNSRAATYELLTQRHPSVVVFVWDTRTNTTTLVKEYHPGPDKFILGTVAGMYEVTKHSSPMESAKFELEEEAKLVSNKWYPLLDNEFISMPFDKYSTNTFYPYLAIDCDHIANGKEMDDEEFIIIEHNVSYDRLMQLLYSGQMNVVSTYAIILGLRKLDELGIKLK